MISVGGICAGGRGGPEAGRRALPVARIVLGVLLLVGVMSAGAQAQPINLHRATSQPAAQGQGYVAPQGNSFGITRVTLALGVVVSLIFAFKWGARRFMIGGAPAGHTRAIQVISRTIVSPRQQLMLVKVGRRLVLVANTGSGMNPICEIRDEQEVAELLGQVSTDRGDSVSKAFSSLFRREEEKFSGPDEADGGEAEEMRAREPVEVGATRDELSGLMEKVRLVSKQFRKT